MSKLVSIDNLATAVGVIKTHYDGELDKKVTVEAGKSLVSDSEIARLASVDNYDDTEVKNSIASKVDKVEGKSLILDTEIERLASVTNYDDTEVKNSIATKVDKVEGKSLILDTEIERLAGVTNYDDTEVRETLDLKADKTYVDNKLVSVYTLKGSVQNTTELEAVENPVVGDVYNVVEEDTVNHYLAGTNFVWNGTAWDALGGTIITEGLVYSDELTPITTDLADVKAQLANVATEEEVSTAVNDILYPTTSGNEQEGGGSESTGA